MGLQGILEHEDEAYSRKFLQALVQDLTALEQMLSSNAFETDITRIGAEQEMFLVDRANHPAPVCGEVLERLADPTFTTEMGKFNLEANLPPYTFSGSCLRDLEHELTRLVGRASSAAQELGAEVLLAGILPSARLKDLTLESLTPKPRYHELNRAVMKLRGGAYHLLIKGLDELQLTHDNVMPEACCSSFQVHFQVDPRRFATLYNAAQIVAAPVLAAAVNSPILLGRRLWQETRIALFQHAVDERSQSLMARNHPTRVSFGEAWVRDSAIEIFREQVARFRVIMTGAVEENSLEVLAHGGVPDLRALRIHNGTVWRWNRPCYGITEGRPHLRLEFRAMPAGPSILDEVANAALFFGLMEAIPEKYGNVSERMPFKDAKENFFAAARHGLKAQLTWLDGRRYPADTLIREQLLTLAASGLKSASIDSADTERYLGVVRDRVAADQTGSRWVLQAMTSLGAGVTPEIRDRRVVAAMLARQNSGEPLHCWDVPQAFEFNDNDGCYQTVADVMSTDLFTVGPNDPVTLAASVMDWQHIRHVPVEDDDGRLVGLVSQRDLRGGLSAGGPVREIMDPKPATVSPETTTVQVVELMRSRRVDCLPVVKEDRLIGIVTSHDMLTVLSFLLHRDRGEDSLDRTAHA